MRILVEPSDYVLRNAGDMAMMQVAIERLSALWPQASIEVLSDAPERMPVYAGNVHILDAAGRRLWYSPGFLTQCCRIYLGNRISDRLLRLSWVAKRIPHWERALRWRCPRLASFLLRDQLRRKAVDDAKLREFLSAVTKADLAIATGMGGVTDAFPKYASELLGTIRLAKHYGASTAMLGQGVGPLHDAELREQARRVLPRVDFISLREGRASKPLLRQLGVRDDRVMTTGDDAIELAYSHRSKTVGAGFGINLRASRYAGVDELSIERLRPILQSVVEKYRAVLIPIVISQVPGEADDETIRKLTRWSASESQSEQQHYGLGNVIDQIQQCRIVVTGSYHAAVFALSLGIPAVGLAASGYYQDKFLGLIDQFGPGCRMLLLHDHDLATNFTRVIDEAWQSAEALRADLLQAAERQIRLSKEAYRKLFEIVEARRKRFSIHRT